LTSGGVLRRIKRRGRGSDSRDMPPAWWPALQSFARTALRARSLHTAWALQTRRVRLAEVRLPGFAGTFRLRTGTSDAHFLRALLERPLPPEYELPPEIVPRTILDIGANIGGVTAALARRYPAARIFAFEPLPENYALLLHNCGQFPLVRPLPYGLGARTAQLTYARSDNPRNFGGGGFYAAAPTAAPGAVDLPVLAVGDALMRFGIDAVDVIKIDTEGAEHDILTGLPPPVLRGVRAIVGELHGKPQDAALLTFLDARFELVTTARRGGTSWFRALRTA